MDVLWGLRGAEESRCEPYDRDDYGDGYSVLEEEIVAVQGLRRPDGLIQTPYDLRCFTSITGSDLRGPEGTDIEHMVSLSEAHDSGMCAKTGERKRSLAADLANLTIAQPYQNRFEKRNLDAAAWQPPYNRCWFARNVVHVKHTHELTVDVDELGALEEMLAGCSPVALEAPVLGECQPQEG